MPHAPHCPSVYVIIPNPELSQERPDLSLQNCQADTIEDILVNMELYKQQPGKIQGSTKC